MRIKERSDQRLVVTASPWGPAFITLLALVAQGIIFTRFEFPPLFHLVFPAMTLGYGFFSIRSFRLELDRTSGEAHLYALSAAGKVERSLPLAQLWQVTVDESTTTSTDHDDKVSTSTTRRAHLQLADGSSIPLSAIGTSGNGPIWLADTVNRWLHAGRA